MSSSRYTQQSALIFNLLDLDAPAIAVVWQMLFVKSLNIPLRPAAIVALALSVWLIYAGDRLFDALQSRLPLVTPRHRFHRAHAGKIGSAFAAALFLLAATCRALAPDLVINGAVLSMVVGIYLLLVHGTPQFVQRWCPKEVVVGVVFAAGTCLGPWTRLGDSGELLIPACLFAALCCMNCVAIEAWEWSRHGAQALSRPHALTLWLAERLRPICILIALVAAGLFFAPGLHLAYGAILLSSVAFLWIQKQQDSISTDGLRVVADLPLLSPLLVIGFRH